MTELQINEQDKKILSEILRKYSYNFYAYGSRIKGTARQYSDLDLCYNYQEDVPSYVAVEIQEELTESRLSLLVELVNWKNMNSSFQQAIQKDLVLISSSK